MYGKIEKMSIFFLLYRKVNFYRDYVEKIELTDKKNLLWLNLCEQF